MRAVRLPAPSSLDKIAVSDMADPGTPGPGQVRVRLNALSLN